MKILVLLMIFSTNLFAANWNGRIFNVKTNSEITFEEYTRELANFSIIVLGEKHYTTEVQAAQADTIRSVVALAHKQGSFTTGWEFLNVSSQSITNELFLKVKNKQITADDFLLSTQGKSPSNSYAAIIDVTADLNGKLLGMNLSRAEKSPVTDGGLSKLDPKLLPPGFEHGAAGYLERFTTTMQGHATPAQIKNYYDSQCLVDDVAAFHLLNDSKDELKFLIIGSFHSDYYDGAVNRLKQRSPETNTVAVKVVDASDFTESELLSVLHDDKYGDIADYVYFVNEPTVNALKESRALFLKNDLSF
jgi:uncharacterized iron-regulated protein